MRHRVEEVATVMRWMRERVGQLRQNRSALFGWSLAALVALLLAGCGGASTTTSAPALPVVAVPSQLAPYHIYVSDLETGDVAELGMRTWHVSRSVHGLGLSSDGHALYVTDISGNRLTAYSTQDSVSSSSQHAAPVGLQPVHMVNTLDGKTIFVTNFGTNTISVINAATWTQTKAITVPDQPHGIVLSPDGRWAYVSCYGGSAIAVLDTAGATLVATIPLPAPAKPYGIAISRDGRYVYASDNLTGRLFIIDATARRVLPSVQVGLRPALLARSPDGAALYVANGGAHSVSVLDLSRDAAHPSVRATVPVEGYPHGIAVTPDGKYVIVANTISKNISIIATASNTVLATIPGEKDPNDVLIAG
jgi:YVTN family beta-propeller protein